MAKDILKREIALNDTVFYNGALYSVVGFSTKDARVKLNYRFSYSLVAPKMRYGGQLIIVPEADVSHYALTLKSVDL
jgi:hypothetical protein